MAIPARELFQQRLDLLAPVDLVAEAGGMDDVRQKAEILRN